MSLLDHPLQLIIVLFSLSVLPLFAVMATSFLKLSVVFSLLRNELCWFLVYGREKKLRCNLLM
ncbi:hypothetical protein [Vibrio marisflavi]|uniref:hypothetical protein n=1 Tax=Vibrio marisflavi TaxID=1216040 RepID=UPI0025B6CB0E|nr:hypothetical protein [Vibrio marisflavi]